MIHMAIIKMTDISINWRATSMAMVSLGNPLDYGWEEIAIMAKQEKTAIIIKNRKIAIIVKKGKIALRKDCDRERSQSWF